MSEKTDNNGKDNKGRFVKGNSFGQGRPKGITTMVKEMSNDYQDYIDILHGWIMDPDQKDDFKRKCIQDVLNRSLGMPSQSMKAEIDMPAPINFLLGDSSKIDKEE